MLELTKIFEFAYAHHLPDYDGPCKNLHGHTAILEVTIMNMSYLDHYPAMVFDFKELKEIVNAAVIDPLDHSYLNDKFEIPTCETVIDWIAMEIEQQLPFGIILKKLKLYETPTSYITWKRGK
ncbi:MAG: 6-carboxytetrahydropterin synthase QueD [Chloroflexi bacterium]|nr:MAG: 6-carboxytetrahydropterin synthase QueD [Chloroflexota bacterium]